MEEERWTDDELDDGTARTGWAEVDRPDWPVP